MKNILVTSALPYINNFPHMGHIVGCHLPADLFYRFSKQQKNNVIFIGGSDEHGTAALISAREHNEDTKSFVDRLSKIHKQIYDKLGISYSIYSGTSSQTHKEITIDFFNTLYKKGYIEEREEKQFYCETDKIFLADRFVEGVCPNCGFEHAYGDQCDKCCSTYNTNELKEPKCKFCGKTPVEKSTNQLYFRLDLVQNELKKWIESKKDIFRPHVYNDAMKWINEGLKPRAITRDISWGIPVPLKGFEDKVFYVWFEAPIGYISFVKELGGENFLQTFWKDKDTEIYNFIGKDNISFHDVFFPAMLLANGNYKLAYNVVGLNFMNYEGQKFSKSKKIGVFCNALLESDIDIDTLRAYLTTVLPESKDSDWKWEGYRDNTNADLVGKFGNFFNRTLNMIYKNFEGKLDIELNELELNELDSDVIKAIKEEPIKIRDLFEKVELRQAYKEIMNFASIGNVYLEKSAPWTLIKNGNILEAKKVLYICLNLARSLAIVVSPIIPNKTAEIWTEQLNLSGKPTEYSFEDATEFVITKSHQTNPPKPLFARIDDERLETLKAEFSKPLEI